MPELYKEQVVGQRIVNIFQTKWEKSKGVDMPGICGEDWYYCQIYIELSNGFFFELSAGYLTPCPNPPQDLIPAEIGPARYVDGPKTYYQKIVIGGNKVDVAFKQVQQRPEPCLNETIIDVFVRTGAQDNIYLLLSSGRYLQNWYLPGGNRLQLSACGLGIRYYYAVRRAVKVLVCFFLSVTPVNMGKQIQARDEVSRENDRLRKTNHA